MDVYIRIPDDISSHLSVYRKSLWNVGTHVFKFSWMQNIVVSLIEQGEYVRWTWLKMNFIFRPAVSSKVDSPSYS